MREREREPRAFICMCMPYATRTRLRPLAQRERERSLLDKLKGVPTPSRTPSLASWHALTRAHNLSHTQRDGGWLESEQASERERARARARERERESLVGASGRSYTHKSTHAHMHTAGSSTLTTSRERSWRSMATPSSKWKRTARRAVRKANKSALDYRARPMLRRPMRRLPTLSKQRT